MCVLAGYLRNTCKGRVILSVKFSRRTTGVDAVNSRACIGANFLRKASSVEFITVIPRYNQGAPNTSEVFSCKWFNTIFHKK